LAIGTTGLAGLGAIGVTTWDILEKKYGGEAKIEESKEKKGGGKSGTVEIVRTVTGAGGVKIEFVKSGYTLAVENICKKLEIDNPKLSRKEVVEELKVHRIAIALIGQEKGPKENPSNITIPPKGLLPGQERSGRFLTIDGKRLLDANGNPIEFAKYTNPGDHDEYLRSLIQKGYKEDESIEDFINGFTYGTQNIGIARSTSGGTIEVEKQTAQTPALDSSANEKTIEEEKSPEAASPKEEVTPAPAMAPAKEESKATTPETDMGRRTRTETVAQKIIDKEEARKKLLKENGYTEKEEDGKKFWELGLKGGPIRVYADGKAVYYNQDGTKVLFSRELTIPQARSLNEKGLQIKIQ
jgi:hypothetical protein